jgi:hypothetical protein
MKYTVVWLPSALERLAEIWNDGPDRAAITQAANRMDRQLLFDPQNQGEARDDNLRIMIDAPLVVYFTVSELDCLVTVRAVWRWTQVE